MSARRRFGLAAIVLGLVAAVTAAVLYAQSPAQRVGDVTSVERSLGNGTLRSVPIDEGEGRLGVDEHTNSSLPRSAALWRTNEDNQLESKEPQPIPIALRVNSLGVDATVDPYGINDSTGQMAVPNNVHDVAWYRHGPVPGEPGSAVLAAHVDLESQGPGVFFDLESMAPGDVIEVLFDNGMNTSFEVVARNKYEKEELPLDTVFSRSGPATLTLVTCGGGFDSSSARYDSNVVVYARPLTVTPPNGLVP